MKRHLHILRLAFLLALLQALSFMVVSSEASEQTAKIKLTLTEQHITGIDEILEGIQNAEGLTYQLGSKGTGVRELQRVLLSNGYSSIEKADGTYGSKTSEAVSEFQAANNLPVTGKADLLTQFSLIIHSGAFTQKGNAYVAQVNNYAVIIWPDKAFYVGAVDKSANLVEGTYYYLDGSYYAGTYRNNLRFGKGTAYFANGDVYIGQWKNDAMHGYGTYYYGGLKAAEYYAGSMANNNMHGYGVFHSKGVERAGQWSNNQHIK